jgi:uncharacterized protein
MLEKIAAYAKDIHELNGDGHGFDHIQRVVHLARQILQDYPEANADIVLAAAYLHDTYDEKLVADVTAAKQLTIDLLEDIAFPWPGEVITIIDNMSFSSNLENKQPLTLEGQIVQDADRLDAIGAMGIVRALQYGFKKGREVYNPNIAPAHFQDKKAYHYNEGTTINHFYEKLFLIKDQLNTAAARRLAAPRDQLMHDFVTQYEREYHEGLD